MKKGFYTGRFQPFHNGHLSAIRQALNEVDFLYIGIGSAQYSRTPDNPFSADERMKMVKMALDENGISAGRFKIIPIPDIHSNQKWTAHVRGLVAEFDVVFVGDDGLVKELFEKYDTAPVKIVKKEIPICATDVRAAMKNNSGWKKHLSMSTVGYLEEISGTDRIKILP